MSSTAAAPPIGDYAEALIVDGVRVRNDQLAEFEVDGCVPGVAVFPANEEQVSTALREAHERGLAVIPLGGATHAALGNVPRRYHVALALGGMNERVAHEPDDLTVTVEAGVRLDTMQARLAPHGQFLPLDPPGADGATMGGVISANVCGPLRHAHGTVRDWLIGVRVVHADGTATKAGGRVVKNVAGYEMTKLYAGAIGTLGVITEATFKLAPIRRVQATGIIPVAGGLAGAALVLRAWDAGLALSACEVLSPAAARRVAGAASWTVLARIAGTSGAVERTHRELAALEPATMLERDDGEQRWQRWRELFAPRELSLRASLLPSCTGAALDALQALGPAGEMALSATVSAGVIRARSGALIEDAAQKLVNQFREIVERANGTLTIESAPDTLKRNRDVFGTPRPDLAIMRRLKEQFDPRGVLAPGRFAGRL